LQAGVPGVEVIELVSLKVQTIQTAFVGGYVKESFFVDVRRRVDFDGRINQVASQDVTVQFV